MKRKNHWVIFAILLLALINLSPSNTATPPSSDRTGEFEPAQPKVLETEQEPKSFKVAVQMSESEFSRLQQMNSKISEELNMDVELTNFPYDSDYTSVQNELRLGEAPDVLLLNNIWVRRFAAEGYLSPTESYYSGSLTGELLTASLAPGEWNGYMWSVPMDADTYVWMIQKDRVQEAGLSLPKNADDWMQLISTYEEKQGIPYLFAFDFSDPYAVLSLLWQLSGNGEDDKSGGAFLPDEARERAVLSIEGIRHLLLNLEGTELKELSSSLNEGKAMFALVRWSEVAGRMDAGTDIIYPNLDDPAAGWMWIDGRSYVVSAQSANKDAAGQWIAAMTDQFEQRQWYEGTGKLPVLKTIYYQSTRGGLPAWIPASFVNNSGVIPADTGFPEWLQKFSEIAALFLADQMDVHTFLMEWKADL
ncbi:hypothetical protein J41TS12_39990 [Paenibacillus antibioticophila]|uniref:ABC transporter substrate-binding protein n=1 Tax=Paenibacillus antibioticophila TaxID=1274374 RepID=A0A919XYZ8_9BACL|nr:extracellular solute-binding protein [Paenibacillus antibioticophila]GIO39138.1 hypothetical protein J41TS12_39990 [Paenibacillus antibioticophila]